MMLTPKEIKPACGHITSTNTIGQQTMGTGYLITAQLVATCEHVVSDAVLATIKINFNGIIKLAKGIRRNERSDCAIIELDEPLVNVTPLVLGGICSWNATWFTCGFPVAAKGSPLTLDGMVSDNDAIDDLQAEVLELTSPSVAAGMATPLHGFSGSPIIVDGVVVGHLKRFLSDPAEPTRPAFGKVYATRAACVHGLLAIDDAELSEPKSVIPPQIDTPAYKDHLDKVHTLLSKWSNEDMPPGQAGLVAAESLIQLGVPEEAINVLDAIPQDVNKVQSVRKSQLFALALAKTQRPENIERAVTILEGLQAEGHFDAETGGLLGGRFKQMWDQSGNKADLERSHKMYLATFAASGDPYPGINAAATALWLGDKPESKRIALEVLAHVDTKSPASMDHWGLATKAEALTLTGDIDQAREWYKKAAVHCDYAPESINTMRSQADKHIDTLGMSKDIFTDVFK